MIETLVGYVEENPQLSLKEIANKLREETGVQLSTNTVHKHLHGRMYTVKKVLNGCINYRRGTLVTE